MSGGHTPGPWRWEVSRRTKRVQLCGGPPKRGFGRYDLTVMGFQRYGMQGAAPVFWDWDYDRMAGEPHRADALAVAVEGREHHADWFADVNHPDARLIAAAPELLEALQALSALPGQVRSDLKSAHAEICKLQGLDPETHDWPEWSPQANTLRWLDKLEAQAAAAIAKAQAQSHSPSSRAGSAPKALPAEGVW